MILERNEIPIHHKARQITVDDFASFDFMLGMDNFNFHELNRFASPLNSKTKIYLLGEFNPDGGDKEIQDPFFDNRQEDFETCFDQITKSCAELLKKLLNRKNSNC